MVSVMCLGTDTMKLMIGCVSGDFVQFIRRYAYHAYDVQRALLSCGASLKEL